MFAPIVLFALTLQAIPPKVSKGHIANVSHIFKKRRSNEKVETAQFCDIDSDGGYNCPDYSLHENWADKCATCGHRKNKVMFHKCLTFDKFL